MFGDFDRTHGEKLVMGFLFLIKNMTHLTRYTVDTFYCELPSSLLTVGNGPSSTATSANKVSFGNKKRRNVNPNVVSAPSNDEDDVWDTVYIPFPEYFAQSRDINKSISIILARVISFEDDPNGIEIQSSLHSDLVVTDASAGNYICATNTLYNFPPEYKVYDNTKTWSCWFYTMNGQLVDLRPSKVRVIIEFLLKW